MSCPDEETVLAFLEGQLSPNGVASMDAHLGGCQACRDLVAASASTAFGSSPDAVASGVETPAPPPASAGPLARGATIGRYVILGLVGRGGMGEVYAAYDPELNRKIALKLLHQDGAREGQADSGARLLREAKAIARLSHPNVIAVHDAGSFGDQVFIAMEFVEGQTLGERIQQRPHSWREIRDLFLAAGRGLAAAHAAGIVHRDFKPQNVMVAPDGSVRVMDFGLASESLQSDTGDREVSPDARLLLHDPPARPAGSALTQTGTLVGTPGYMASEQFLARPADARTDQFSFCVALHEALYGERPFAGDSLATLAEAVTSGRLREPAQKDRAPSWLRKILLRGLRTDRQERFPSMDALLTAMARDPEHRRRRIGAAAAVAALLLGGGAVAQRTLGRSGQTLCRGAAAKLVDVWEVAPDPAAALPRHAAVRAAFLGTGQAFAVDSWQRVRKLLDGYAQGWVGSYTDACEATNVRGEQSPEVLDLRMDCLNRNLIGLRALVGVFASADGEVVAGAVRAALQLPDLERCNDVIGLRAVLPLPRDPAARRRIDDLRRRSAELKALTDAEKTDEALRRSASLIPDARAAGYGPLLAEVLSSAGLAQRYSGDAAGADRAWQEAIELALASRADELAADTMAMLAAGIGFDFGRSGEADRLTGLGEAMAARLGPGHDRTRGWLEQARGNTRLIEGKAAEAQTAYRRAVALKEKALGANHPDVALSLNGLALALVEGGDAQAALDVNTRAVAIVQQAFGPESPELGNLLMNRGEALNALGRPLEALALFDRSMRVWQPALGADSSVLAYPLTGRGQSLLLLGRPAEAIMPLERALERRQKVDQTAFRLGETRFALARALWDGGGDRPRAIALASAARHDFTVLPPRPANRAEVDAWLAAHLTGGRPGAARGSRPPSR